MVHLRFRTNIKIIHTIINNPISTAILVRKDPNKFNKLFLRLGDIMSSIMKIQIHGIGLSGFINNLENRYL